MHGYCIQYLYNTVHSTHGGESRYMIQGMKCWGNMSAEVVYRGYGPTYCVVFVWWLHKRKLSLVSVKAGFGHAVASFTIICIHAVSTLLMSLYCRYMVNAQQINKWVYNYLNSWTLHMWYIVRLTNESTDIWIWNDVRIDRYNVMHESLCRAPDGLYK